MRELTPLYRHVDVALLRAATAPLTDASYRWPDPADLRDCRDWLDEVWSRAEFAEAIQLSSPTLADRVAAIRAGRRVADKQIRRATLATARYLLRSIGRPTPFGLFAGVAPATVGASAAVRWGHDHQCLARVNTVWLGEIIDRLEANPQLLDRLDVQDSDLVVRRGTRLEVPHGPNRASIRDTRAVAVARHRAATPIRFAALVAHLSAYFPGTTPAAARAMLTDLVHQGFLISSLRAPFTVTDPLGHVLDQLRAAGADTLASTTPPLAALLADLADIRTGLRRHNTPEQPDQRALREAVTRRMGLLGGTRIRLTADLALDCAVRLPDQVAQEMERAAGALLRLTRHPVADPVWSGYHAAFVDRYGTGTAVPVAEVLDPDAGLGYPATYPGSVLPAPNPGPAHRDQRLLGLALEAITTGNGEIVLTDQQITDLTGEGFDEQHIPPHVELAARIHASSLDALDRGEFTLSVAPARAAGTLTSRFTPLATGSGLAEAYRALPAATANALRVQLSFGPLYPNAENVCRVPAYLDHLLPLGEHRDPDDTPEHVTLLSQDDLAVTAARERLYLISLSRRQVVEPQVFHALDLRKQPPPLVRFLAGLPRAFSAGWYQFDWGQHADLPRLPRVRYRRTILSPAQWRLTTQDIPDLIDDSDPAAWRQAVDRWRDRWSCPAVAELREVDRTLRLALDEPAHLALLHAHLTRHGHAVLTEAAPTDQFGWLAGHVHEVAFPLVAATGPAPNPLHGPLPVVTNTDGQLPGSPDARWLSAKLFTHPERMNEIITHRLPQLLADIDASTVVPAGPACWWLRYRNPHETDHLRLRVRLTPGLSYGRCAELIGEWADQTRDANLIGRLVLDSYYPENGRYGHGAALDAAEDVFVADSRLVTAQLHAVLSDADLTVLTVVNLVGIVQGFLGDLAPTMRWLVARPARATATVDRDIAGQAISAALDVCASGPQTAWTAEVSRAWQARAAALATYRTQLPADAHRDSALESLLHLHHNRAIGIDPDSETACRRLARQAALAWHARQPAEVGEPA